MLQRRRFPCLAFVVLAPWAVANLNSQTAADSMATIKAQSRLVLVDVVVTNDKGESVTGLQKKDFEVLEEGKAQSIATFEEHHAAPITEIQMPVLPPHVYTNFPLIQAADSINVILLDALNTPTRDQVYVRAQMLQYLKTIPSGTRVAIFTLASQLRMLQAVTTDSTQLLAALNTMGAQQSGLLPSEGENEANDHFVQFMQQEDMGRTPPNRDLAAVDPVQVASQFVADTAAFQTAQRIGITLDALQHLALYLAGVPGRKNVIWFSGSFPSGIFGDPDLVDPFDAATSFQEEIRKTTNLLASAQLALYPVAAEGLASDVVYQANAQKIGEKRPSLAMRDQLKQMQVGETSRDLNHSTMEFLAKDTGGQAYYNTNGLSGALARVVNNGSRYYSLTYSPTNTAMDGKFRRIQVKLLSGKANLAYRRGYYAEDLETRKKPNADPLLPLLGRNMPDYTQILLKLLVQPSDPQPPAHAARIGSNTDFKGPITRYSVDFAIPVGDLRLDPASDGSRHGSIEVALIAYDEQGKPLNLVVSRGELSLQPHDYASMLKSGLPIHREIDVPQSRVFLRTGVYDLNASKTGTYGVPLTPGPTPSSKGK
jgi:VWFA-related protein